MAVVPKHYTLVFEPYFSQFRFRGRATLLFRVTRPTTSFALDALDIDCETCILKRGSKLIDMLVERDKSAGKLHIRTAKRLPAGDYSLTIDYWGTLNDHLSGFYRSAYIYEEKKNYIATSQFEAADARRAFPCIDNPAYKATFDVTLVIDKHLVGVSNTLPKRETIQKNKRHITFETSPLMSTYLLYLGVGNFEMREGRYRNILVRGITTQGQSEYTRFAIEWAQKCLAFYEEYFDYAYPLKKLDLIAVPDFSSAAMENWGAITFRENVLLYYPGKSSLATKQRIAEVVAHEIVHQWFGNLVTMKWWDDLWLNESFATYMAYKAVDHFYPEWNIWTEYVSYSAFGGMVLDSLKSTHAINVKVESTDQIDELFDEIAYEKGGSILRMLDLYLGEETFRKGLRAYIKTYAYRNTQAHDLWNMLEKSSRVPVISLMEKYIRQIGFPVVYADKRDTGTYLTQERFSYLNTQVKTKWYIPLITYDGVRQKPLLLNTKTKQIQSVGKNMLYLNKDYAGFFITRYDKYLLGLLGKNRQRLNERDVLGLIHDLFALVVSTKENLQSFLSFLESFFYDEKDPEVLAYIIAKLSSIYLLLGKTTIREVLADLSTAALRITGYEPQKEKAAITALRTTAFSALLLIGEKKALEFTRLKFEEYMQEESSLHPDIRSVVYAGAVLADRKNYFKVKERYVQSRVEEEKVKLLSALTKIEDLSLFKDTLDFALSPHVRFSNSLYVLAGASGNQKGKEITYRWFMYNWNELKLRTGGHSKSLLRRLMKLILPVCGIGHEKEVKEFLRRNTIVGLERTYKQVEEELMVNSRFVDAYKEKPSF